MKTKLFPFFLFLSLSFSACQKEAETADTTPTPQYAKMEVKVRICEDAVCNSFVPVPGAQVYLFEDEQYQQQGDHIVFEGATDGFGKITFPALDKPLYWLTVQHPDGRKIEESVKTPARSISYPDIVFEKN